MAASLGTLEGLAVGLGLSPDGVRVAESLGLPTPGLAASSWWLGSAPRGTQSLALVGAEPTWRRKLARARWVLVPSRARIRYVAGLPRGRPWSLAKGYCSWWLGLGRDLPAVANHVLRRRR